uniref:Cytochrome c oxidase subunit 8 n=1 Tax=Vombatus ursinus TaxID=29139 RepID=A0A4X2KXU1_VOMUR
FHTSTPLIKKKSLNNPNQERPDAPRRRPPARAPRTPARAPAREELSLLDKTIAMTASFICLLLPTAWILSHLDSYKKKE